MEESVDEGDWDGEVIFFGGYVTSESIGDKKRDSTFWVLPLQDLCIIVLSFYRRIIILSVE